MKASKVVFTLKTETLSKDCVTGLIRQAAEMIDREFNSGEITSDDGDTVSWNFISEKVEF